MAGLLAGWLVDWLGLTDLLARVRPFSVLEYFKRYAVHNLQCIDCNTTKVLTNVLLLFRC